MRYEMASSVQLGLVLPRAKRATSIFRSVSIRPREAGAGRRGRSLPVLRHRPRGLPISLAGGARAGNGGCPEHRRQDASPGTPSRPSRPPFSPRLRRPSSRSATASSRCQLSAMAKVSGFSRRFDPWRSTLRELLRKLSRERARGRLGAAAGVAIDGTMRRREAGAQASQATVQLLVGRSPALAR